MSSEEKRSDCASRLGNQPNEAEKASDKDRDCAKKCADEKAKDAGMPDKVDFSTFMFSLATQALALLGEAKLPGYEDIPLDINGARQTIDIIEMLEEKAKSGLNEDEGKLISNLLYDLRIRYIKATKKQ